MTANPFDDPRVAGLYDAFDSDRSDLLAYTEIAEELGAGSLVDIGCGTGTFAIALAEHGLDVTAVDPAAAMLDVARAKDGAGRVRWVHGDASSLRDVHVVMATMTGNTAQAIVRREEWRATLRAVRSALHSEGHLVFETRDPQARAWKEWNRASSYSAVEIDGIGPVESWDEVTKVDGPLVTFRSTTVFPGGEALTSESTLRFRTRGEVVDDLAEAGYVVIGVRDAPDRPGRELVFVARRAA